MYRLKDTGHTPQCGWIYEIPEIKHTVKADSYEELLSAVNKLYKINNRFPPDNLEDLIHDYICKLNPTGFCHGFVNKVVFSVRALLNGTAAMSVIMRQGNGAFVDQSTAEERAKICSTCEMNVENPTCFTCKGFADVIERVRRGRTSTLDSSLKVCAMCGCFIKALIHVNKAVLTASTRNKSLKYYPLSCWKRKELMENNDETNEKS